MSDSLDKKKFLALIVVLILVGLAIVTALSRDPEAKKVELLPSTATNTNTATISPTSIPTQVPPTFTPYPTAVPTLTVLLYGEFVLDTEMIAGLIHELYIEMSRQITVEVQECDNGAIWIAEEPPWVNLTGVYSDTGQVTAAGSGVVAGYPDVSVTVSGTLKNDYFDGTLIMGAEKELPGGEAGVYAIQGPYKVYTYNPDVYIGACSTMTVEFNNFVDGFNYAMQILDTSWLYDHLHPSVFERYDPDACQEYLDRTVQPEFEIVVKGLSGPEEWFWEVDGEVIEIENAITANSELTIKGEEINSDVHFAITNGQFTWFTTCVNPQE